MPRKPRLAIITHDGKKADLVAFATFNRDRLSEFQLIATSSTGKLLKDKVGLEVACVESGPLGGDVQIASRVVAGEVNAVIFRSIRSTGIRMNPISRRCSASARSATCRSRPTARRRTP